MSTFVKVAKTHDLAEGGMVAVLVGDTEILLAQVQGQYTINRGAGIEGFCDQAARTSDGVKVRVSSGGLRSLCVEQGATVRRRELQQPIVALLRVRA